MITIQQNPNFPIWFRVFAFGQFIDEVKHQSRAVHLATCLAKVHDKDVINVNGKVQKI